MNKKYKKSSDLTDKILKGLELVSERLIADKKRKNQDLVILEGDQIKIIKASEL